MATHIIAGGRLPIPPAEQLPGPDRLAPAQLAAYLALMERCWHQDRDARPSFAQVIGDLRWGLAAGRCRSGAPCVLGEGGGHAAGGQHAHACAAHLCARGSGGTAGSVACRPAWHACHTHAREFWHARFWSAASGVCLTSWLWNATAAPARAPSQHPADSAHRPLPDTCRRILQAVESEGTLEPAE